MVGKLFCFLEAEHGTGSNKQRKSFLDHLLYIQKENSAILSDKDIRDEVNTFMFEVRTSSPKKLHSILSNIIPDVNISNST